MKVRKIMLVVSVITVLIISACGNNGSSTDAVDASDTAKKAEVEKRELVMAHHNSQISLTGQTHDKIMELFNEYCDTAYITVYHNSELGTINQLLESVTVGTIDINGNGFGQSSTLYGPMELFDMPYLVKNREDAMKLMNIKKNDVLAEIIGEFEDVANVHVVAVTGTPEARNLTCNFAVYSPADLEGVKIRSITNDVFTLAVAGLGAIPVPIDWSECPTSLSTGVIEGQENPYSVLSDYQLYDVQKYVMETGHIYGGGLYMVNQDTWDSMTTDEKSALEKAINEASEWEYDYRVGKQEEYKQNCIDNGMEVITAAEGLDVDAFKANTQRLLEEKYPQYKDYFKRINEYLGYE